MMNNSLLLKSFKEYLEARRYRPASIKGAQAKIEDFFEYTKIDLRDVGSNIITEYFKHLRSKKSRYGKPLAPSTIVHYQSALKVFFRYLLKHEYILINRMEDFDLSGLVVKKERKIFSYEQVNRLLDSVVLKDAETERDRAIFELAYSSGLRLSEITGLELDDVDTKGRVLLIKDGKGGKDRFVPFSEVARQFILLYVKGGRKKHTALSGKISHKLFLDSGKKLTSKRIAYNLKKYLERCGLKDEGFTFHSLRHTCATHLLEQGADIRYVQELLGHEDIKTTQVYTRPTQDNIRKHYRMHHPRENQLFEEIDQAYLADIKKLKEVLSRR